MTRYFVVLNRDDNGNVLAKRTEQSIVLEIIADKGINPAWNFEAGGHTIRVYGAALQDLPVGESKEEFEALVLQALNLS